MRLRGGLVAALLGSLGLAFAGGQHAVPPAHAETVLRGAMFIEADRSLFRALFNQFVERVNSEGEGLLRIDPVLGPGAIPGFEMHNALREGIIDIAGLPPAYYRGQIVEADALQLATIPPDRQREIGVIDRLQERFHSVGWHLLAQYGYDVQFHLFTNKPVTGVDDLADLTLRTTSTYRAFFDLLGSNQVETSRGELYTAMERGVVDGYANAMSEVAPAGWDEVSKYRIDPGFYHAIVTIMMNLDAWESLNDEQKALLERAALEVETELAADMAERDRQAGAEMVERGMEVITFKGEDAERFVQMANDAYWGLLEAEDAGSIAEFRTLLSGE